MSAPMNGTGAIRFIDGPLAGQTLALNKPQLMIGREPGTDITVNNPAVSRQHARLVQGPTGWVIEKINPQNTVQVNGRDVAQSPLRHGDTVAIGPITFQFMEHASVAAGHQPGGTVVSAPPQPPYPAGSMQTVGAAAPPYHPGSGPSGPSYQATPSHPNAPGIPPGMPSLEVIIHEGRNEGRNRYPLNKPVITIGRDPSNDIVIPAGVVSRQHAEITQQGNMFQIIDKGSVNGIYSQGHPIKQKQLAHGDLFRIGDLNGTLVTLVFDSGSGAPLDQAPPPAMQQFALAGAPAVVTIGRAPGNTILLNHPLVSQRHAELARDPRSGVYVLTDKGSTNGTYVNGRRISGRVRLDPGNEVRIGPFRFVFTGTELTQHDESGNIRVDAYDVFKVGDVSGLKKLFGSGKPNVLLNHLSFSIAPRKFVAMVGGSGAGKSTLMDALNGLRPAQQGLVLYNGNDYYRHLAAFSTSLGYVPQDDIIHRDLTVERALYYAAKMRLPDDTNNAQIEQRISEVLADVEMTHRRKLLISKLSGGQRKRVSIAVELLARPSVFFLDEPTSGLDPGLDRKMMFLLRRLADRGHTIVLVTHATNNISACDYVCFLAQGGRLAYFGPPDEAKRFFGKTDFAEIYSELEPSDDHPNAPAEWEGRFRGSQDYQKYIVQPLQQSQAATRTAQMQRTASLPQPKRGDPVRQFRLLAGRYTELLRNDTANMAILLLQAPIIAALLIFLTKSNIFASHLGNDIDAQTPLFIMAAAAVWFGTINAAREIVKEAPIYRRERTVNLGLFPYVMSKVCVLGFLCLIQSFLLLAIVGLKSGYPDGIIFPAFVELYISLILTALGGLMMGLAVSAIAPNTDRAMSVVPLLLIPQIIFAGSTFKLSGATEIISYFIVTRWGLEALGDTVHLHSQLCVSPRGQQDVSSGGGCPVGFAKTNPTLTTPDNFYGHDLSHLLFAWLMLILLTVAFLALTIYFQRRKDVRK
ncbi:MAG TPA: FHA domain-containing protein [Ktedonobacterales bacterium]|jgi:ABC-type multidrug transport system ATPase subunit/predicted component of type VI protein secretion system